MNRHVPSVDFSTRPTTYELSFSKAERSSEMLRSAQNDRLSKTFIDVVLVLDNGVEIPRSSTRARFGERLFQYKVYHQYARKLQRAHSPSRRRFGLHGGPRRFRVYGKNFNHFWYNDVTLFCTADRLLFEDVVDYCCTGLAKST